MSLPSIAESQSSRIFLVIALVIGPELGLLPSSPPCSGRFVLKSQTYFPSVKGISLVRPSLVVSLSNCHGLPNKI